VETRAEGRRKWGEVVKGIAAGEARLWLPPTTFHRRTIAIVGFSTEEQYRFGFGPFPAGFREVPFGDIDGAAGAITAKTCAFLVEARSRARRASSCRRRATCGEARRSAARTMCC